MITFENYLSEHIKVITKLAETKLNNILKPYFQFTTIEFYHKVLSKDDKLSLQLLLETSILPAVTARNQIGKFRKKQFEFKNFSLDRLLDPEDCAQQIVDTCLDTIFKWHYKKDYKYILEALDYIFKVQQDPAALQETYLEYEGELLFYKLRYDTHMEGSTDYTPFVSGLVAQRKRRNRHSNNNARSLPEVKRFFYFLTDKTLRIKPTCRSQHASIFNFRRHRADQNIEEHRNRKFWSDIYKKPVEDLGWDSVKINSEYLNTLRINLDTTNNDITETTETKVTTLLTKGAHYSLPDLSELDTQLFNFVHKSDEVFSRQLIKATECTIKNNLDEAVKDIFYKASFTISTRKYLLEDSEPYLEVNYEFKSLLSQADITEKPFTFRETLSWKLDTANKENFISLINTITYSILFRCLEREFGTHYKYIYKTLVGFQQEKKKIPEGLSEYDKSHYWPKLYQFCNLHCELDAKEGPVVTGFRWVQNNSIEGDYNRGTKKSLRSCNSQLIEMPIEIFKYNFHNKELSVTEAVAGAYPSIFPKIIC